MRVSEDLNNQAPKLSMRDFRQMKDLAEGILDPRVEALLTLIDNGIREDENLGEA